MLILKRNAARDYIDFAALADRLGDDRVVAALRSFDRLYPQESGESALQQLQSQLANPLPYDEKTTDLSKYRNLDPKWHDWRTIKTTCKHVSIMVFDRVCEESEMDEAGARTGPFPAQSAGCRLPSLRPRAAGGRGQALEGPSGAGGATVRRRCASARPCR